METEATRADWDQFLLVMGENAELWREWADDALHPMGPQEILALQKHVGDLVSDESDLVNGFAAYGLAESLLRFGAMKRDECEA